MQGGGEMAEKTNKVPPCPLSREDFNRRLRRRRPRQNTFYNMLIIRLYFAAGFVV